MFKGKWHNVQTKYREQVKSLYRNGKRTDEIADKLGISENTVVLILEDAGMI